MRKRSTAWRRPGAGPGRWLGLALLAISVSGPAAAEQAAPDEAPADLPDAPDEAATTPAGFPDAPPEAPPEAPDTPDETRGTYRVALIDVPPTPQQTAAATILVPAARDAIRDDGRFVLATPEQVAAARSEHGVSNTDLTYPDACRVGRAVGARHAILIGGYDLTLHTAEKKSSFKQARGMVAEQPPGHGAAYSPPTARFEFEARVTASFIVMDMTSCKVAEQAVIRAHRESDVSVDAARNEVEDDFVQAVRQGLQKLFPLQAFVRAPRAHGGIIGHGSRQGVRHGQYYAVRRDGRVVGEVHVDEVAPDSAQVSLVRGVQRLRPGDWLTERDTLQMWEVGIAATPSVLSRREADDTLGLAASVHSSVSEPVSGNVYGVMLEYLNASKLERWRGGVHYARQIRLLPRRLFVHARLGVGAYWARQPLVDETDQMYDRATVRGVELLNGLGIKALLGRSLAVQAEISYPLPLRGDRWRLSSNDKLPAPADDLLYTRVQKALPTLTLGVGLRF